MTYTLRVYHTDDNQMLLAVEADTVTKAFTEAALYCEQRCIAIKRIELDEGYSLQ